MADMDQILDAKIRGGVRKKFKGRRCVVKVQGVRFVGSYLFFLTNNQRLIVKAFSLSLLFKFGHGVFLPFVQELGISFRSLV